MKTKTFINFEIYYIYITESLSRVVHLKLRQKWLKISNFALLPASRVRSIQIARALLTAQTPGRTDGSVLFSWYLI